MTRALWKETTCPHPYKTIAHGRELLSRCRGPRRGRRFPPSTCQLSELDGTSLCTLISVWNQGAGLRTEDSGVTPPTANDTHLTVSAVTNLFTDERYYINQTASLLPNRCQTGHFVWLSLKIISFFHTYCFFIWDNL